MNLVILDYGLGNIRSVMNYFKKHDLNIEISKDFDVLQAADAIILPGVGAYRDAMTALKPFQSTLDQLVSEGKPLIGICLGMQLLFERSYEGGVYEGLAYIKGDVVPFETNLKVPHMGWNNLDSNHELLNNLYVYYVHSYYVNTMDYAVATTQYDACVPGIVRKDNVLGFQFHPEKSGESGLPLMTYIKEFLNDNISSN